MSKPLPLRANLEWLRKLCKQRLDEPRAADRNARLSQAQLAVAREYGFPSWRKLKAHVEQQREQLDALVPPSAVRQAAREVLAPDDPAIEPFFAAIAAGESQSVADQLDSRPVLANNCGHCQ